MANTLHKEADGLHREVCSLKVKVGKQSDVIAERDTELQHALGQAIYLKRRAIKNEPVIVLSPADWF